MNHLSTLLLLARAQVQLETDAEILASTHPEFARARKELAAALLTALERSPLHVGVAPSFDGRGEIAYVEDVVLSADDARDFTDWEGALKWTLEQMRDELHAYLEKAGKKPTGPYRFRMSLERRGEEVRHG
jgi:hypothetical protein